MSAKRIILFLLIFSVAWVAGNITQQETLSGNGSEFASLTVPRVSQEVLTPYNVDVESTLATLKQYRGLYFIGAAIHGGYLIFK